MSAAQLHYNGGIGAGEKKRPSSTDLVNVSVSTVVTDITGVGGAKCGS